MKLANVRGYSLTYRTQIPLELKGIAMWRRRIDEEKKNLFMWYLYHSVQYVSNISSKIRHYIIDYY